jgi:hypothetical protein
MRYERRRTLTEALWVIGLVLFFGVDDYVAKLWAVLTITLVSMYGVADWFGYRLQDVGRRLDTLNQRLKQLERGANDIR